LKSIILAAGEGKRLRPLTSSLPKSMIDIFGIPLLQRQINTMKECGIKDIIVITGYKSELINIPGVTYRTNQNYDTTNMVETLFCAKDDLEDDTIISYADILFEKKVLKNLMKSNHDMSIVIDLNWKEYWDKRFDNPLDDAETLKINSEGNIVEIGQKPKNIEEINGQYIGLMKFNSDGLKVMKNFYEKCKSESRNGTNPLNPKIVFEKSYMTDLLQGLINNSNELKPVFTNGHWIEIDSMQDYELIHKMFNENKLTDIINLDN
jgi:choline kinase|tara:strand:+ start:22 stop:813 length:792 start_codon:yes stop_codon:yes gene_type:complete